VLLEKLIYFVEFHLSKYNSQVLNMFQVRSESISLHGIPGISEGDFMKWDLSSMVIKIHLLYP
jgi:hypothetical protein